MNKKLLIFGALTMSMIVVVSAIAYYEVFSVNINVNQPISVGGNLDQSIDCDAGESCMGELITVSNSANSLRNIIILDNSEGVQVSYVSELSLSEKVVDFNLDVWDLLPEGRTATVEYTLVGDSFTAKIVGGEIIGYGLYYYADNDDRFTNPNTVVLVSEVSENLPMVGDENAINDYSAEYPTTPHGAKIWYIPTAAVNELGEIDWSQADSFLFETSLIQFNSEGNIIVYPGQSITFTPVFSVDTHAETGIIPIEITIA